MILNGILTSKWDGGAARFDTKATLNTETGEVTSLEMIDGDELEGLEILTDEFFTDENDEKYQVCEQCHQYITKSVMIDDRVGNGIHEEHRCMGGCDE